MYELIISTSFMITLLQATLRTTTPLLLASIGGLYSERSGVLCIGMEGIMLVGAFAGFVGTYFSKSLLVGLILAMIAGALVSLIYAYLTITIGGAYLSLAHANTFIENMTAQKGYIAFAIVIFGKYNPIGALGAALLFGFAEALQLRLQAGGINIPYQYLLMLPYILTIIGMIAAGKTDKPAALGTAYLKK